MTIDAPSPGCATRSSIDPAVIADQVAALRPGFRALATEIADDLGEVVLTGCGDSFFAGLGVQLAFQRVAGVRCHALEALELARYDVRHIPSIPRPLLVAISYSGEVGRTIEAAATASAFGWRTIALTGQAQGRLALAVERPMLMDVPTLGFTPGTSTYLAMLTALLVLAAELARSRGRAAAADALDSALTQAPEQARWTLDAGDAPARVAAVAVAESPVTTYLGAGPSKASACFGAAKLFEGPQRYGVAQDLEEWAHEQYFVSRPGTPIVVVAPSGGRQGTGRSNCSTRCGSSVPGRSSSAMSRCPGKGPSSCRSRQISTRRSPRCSRRCHSRNSGSMSRTS